MTVASRRRAAQERGEPTGTPTSPMARVSQLSKQREWRTMSNTIPANLWVDDARAALKGRTVERARVIFSATVDAKLQTQLEGVREPTRRKAEADLKRSAVATFNKLAAERR